MTNTRLPNQPYNHIIMFFLLFFLTPLFTFQELKDAKKKPKGKGIGTKEPSASSIKIDENSQHKTYS
jgi:hypothetical protein